MTTTITVAGASIITSIHHDPDGDRETVEKTYEAPSAKHVDSFLIHNTLSLRIEGAGARVTVAASNWPVSADPNSDFPRGQVVKPGTVKKLVVGEKGLTLRDGVKPAVPAGAD